LIGGLFFRVTLLILGLILVPVRLGVFPPKPLSLCCLVGCDPAFFDDLSYFSYRQIIDVFSGISDAVSNQVHEPACCLLQVHRREPINEITTQRHGEWRRVHKPLVYRHNTYQSILASRHYQSFLWGVLAPQGRIPLSTAGANKAK
jgi:hypothetical protein